MSLLTRQQLIDVGRWPTAEVPTESGPVKIAAASSGAILRIRQVRKRGEKGEDVELDLMTETLAACCVDGANAPLFASAGHAIAALESFTLETLTALLVKCNELNAASVSVKAVDPGNSAASQSAGSPSGSA